MLEFTLPDREEMTARLLQVDNDPHKIQKFYPVVVENLAGKIQFPEGFLMGWTLAVSDYVRGMPEVAMTMEVSTHLYVSALIDDLQARSAVMDLLKVLGLPTGDRRKE